MEIQAWHMQSRKFSALSLFINVFPLCRTETNLFLAPLLSRFSRGYAEAEIEAVFAKYDLDGDRVLDEGEQRKMQSDLEGQRVRRQNFFI